MWFDSNKMNKNKIDINILLEDICSKIEEISKQNNHGYIENAHGDEVFLRSDKHFIKISRCIIFDGDDIINISFGENKSNFKEITIDLSNNSQYSKIEKICRSILDNLKNKYTKDKNIKNLKNLNNILDDFTNKK